MTVTMQGFLCRFCNFLLYMSAQVFVSAQHMVGNGMHISLLRINTIIGNLWGYHSVLRNSWDRLIVRNKDPSQGWSFGLELSNPDFYHMAQTTIEECAVRTFRASKCQGRATAHNFAEFAQNLEMCTPKLEKLFCLLLNFYMFFACFCTLYVTFQVFFAHFLAQNYQKLSFDCARKPTFRRSAHLVTGGQPDI